MLESLWPSNIMADLIEVTQERNSLFRKNKINKKSASWADYLN